MKVMKELDSKTARAVIYCRVSSARQREEGSGLESQEHRCRQYAIAQGYIVDEVFPDDASGGGNFMKRPGMVALLRFLDDHASESYVVIFDDLKRFARDRDFHFKLRRELAARGARVECLNFRFEDTPEGEFIETVVAAQGHLERLQNSRQVRQKMRACIEQGYYVFGKIRGYLYIEREGGGKMLAPDPETAPIIREGLEGFATGQFQTATEIKRYFDQFPEMSGTQGGEGVALQSVFNMLKNPLYAGRITVAKYGLHLLPGKHEPIINFATWQKIQERLDMKSIAPARKDLNHDFPLRGFVECAECAHPMSAAWSKGRSASYPYYFCFQKTCSAYKKSVRKEKMEAEFEALLKSLHPTPMLIKLAYEIFADLWNMRFVSAERQTAKANTEIAKLEQKSSQLIDRIVETDNASLLKAYEVKLKKMEEQKIGLMEKAAKIAGPHKTFEETFRTAISFLAKPWNLWASELLEHKRTVLRLVFSTRLAYCRNEGFRTGAISEPFRLLGTLAGPGSRMVEGVGFEPTYAKRPDLQSGGFNHSPTPPQKRRRPS